jgi:hypothetical protein
MDEIHSLKRKAAQFRALAEEHRAAGHDAIAKKLAGLRMSLRQPRQHNERDLHPDADEQRLAPPR